MSNKRVSLCLSARDDLAKLQRQFRLTEGSRKQYADQATNTLRKQQYVYTMATTNYYIIVIGAFTTVLHV